MALMKCIEIDPFTETVKYVHRELPVQFGKFPNSKPHNDGQMFCKFDDSQDGETELIYCLYYQKPDPSQEEAICDKGFLWIPGMLSDKELAERRANPYSSNLECIGKALIVAFEQPGYTKNGARGPRKTVDVDLPLEYARERLIEWTNGIFRIVPEFTCMLNEKFSDPGSFELLLRLENRDLLDTDYERRFDKPLTHINPQLITFEYEFCEFTIVTGKITGNLNNKTRVAIFRTDTPELKQLDACTMAAHKIPNWVKNTLEKFYEDQFIWSKSPSLKKLSRNLDLHQQELS